MHAGNHQFLNSIKTQYPDYFRGKSVLELGSLNINGTVRIYFDQCQYIGVDKTAGPDVDLVCEAKSTSFQPGQFDTIVCTSMFEHDPDWKQSFGHNLQWLKSGGLWVASWGAEGNRHHAPDPWAPVLMADMREFVKTLPLHNVDIFWEREKHAADCDGCADMTAFKV